MRGSNLWRNSVACEFVIILLQLRQMISKLLPDYFGSHKLVVRESPCCAIGHWPVFGMIQSADFDPNIVIRIKMKRHRRPTVGAKTSRSEATGSVRLWLALGELEGSPRNPNRSAKQAAVRSLTHRAMTIVALHRCFVRLKANGTAKATTC